MNPGAAFGFLRQRRCQVLTAVLLLQAGAFYGFSRDEIVAATRPLSEFPARMNDWRTLQEGVVEDEVREKLRADDLLNRFYTNESGTLTANLFIAYFKTQRTGQAPHSPKNCLPGSGWVYSRAGEIPVAIPGQAQPIHINRYIVTKGEHSSVVLYWYQTGPRVVASEYWAKIYLVTDSIRYNRSDTALVRVTVPVVNGEDEAATQTALRLVQSLFPHLAGYLPA